ncbi:MAG: hypothetical protein KAQ83_01935 [Nanoarchaeota archaeon]|nr:hypothetical protein [Nanoarchaeota archaeon]
MGKTNYNNTKRLSNKSIFLMVFALLVISLTSASTLATEVIMGNSGNNVREKASGNLLESGTLIVTMYTSSIGGTLIYNETFEDIIDNGSWDVTLGTQADLDLECLERYYLDYYIEGENVNFEDNDGNAEDRKAFDSTYGCIETNTIPSCSDDQIIKWNDLDGNWSCDEDNSTAMPSCIDNQILRKDVDSWGCVSEQSLPNCANEEVLVTETGSWACNSKSEIQLNQAEIEAAVGNWKDSSGDYSTSVEIEAACTNASEVSDQIINEGFSGSFNDLIETPNLVNQTSMEDYIGTETSEFVNTSEVSDQIINEGFSGSFNDLINQPTIPTDVVNLSDNTGAFFSGVFGDLSGTPDFMNQSEVETFIDGEDYVNDSEMTSSLSTKQNTLVGNEAIFDAWDKDASDDFDSDYNNLINAPDFMNQSEVETFVTGKDFINSSDLVGYDSNSSDDLSLLDVATSLGNWSEDQSSYYTIIEVDNKNFLNLSDLTGYATESYVDNNINSLNYSDINNTPDLSLYDANASDDFDGIFTSLTSIPSGLDDGDNDTQLNQSEVSSYMVTEYPNLDTDSTNDFDSAWTSLTGRPASLDDGDNDTQLTDAQVSTAFLNENPETDTNVSDDFDANWTSLTDVPSDIADGDNNTQLSGLDIVNKVGNWSDDQSDYYTTTQFGDGFNFDGNKINMSFNESLFAIKNGQLTLGDRGSCGVDGSELLYNCSANNWYWTDKTTYLKDTGDTATGSYIFDSSTFVVDSVNHKVGMGTKTPAKQLEIQTNNIASLEYPLLLQNPNSSISSAVGVLFGVDDNVSYAKGGIVYNRTLSHGRGDFHFLQEYHAGGGEPTLAESVMTIKNNGDVGIGITNPVVALDVDGVIRTTPRATATCDTTTEGAIYYDSDVNTFYGCNSTDWVSLN